jgi:hypothetical protein
MNVIVRTTQPEAIVTLNGTTQGPIIFKIVSLVVRIREYINTKKRDVISKVLIVLSRITFRTLNYLVRYNRY